MRPNEAAPAADWESQPSRRALGNFVSLRTLASTLGRKRRLWVGTALVGLIIGIAVPVALPKTYESMVTLVLSHNPGDDPTVDMANDAAIAQTPPVAQLAINRLGLKMSSSLMLKQYEVVSLSDEILELDVKGPTQASSAARANALAAAFLLVRSRLLESQNAAVVSSLSTQKAVLQSQATTLRIEIDRLGTGTSPSSRAQMATLTAERQAVLGRIAPIEQTITSDNLTTSSIVSSSRVLAPATPVQSSRLKRLLADGGTGLIAGLVVGCALVLLVFVLSERLRRRDDFAWALSAPVGLSVGKMPRPRFVRAHRLWWRTRNPRQPERTMARYLGQVIGRTERPARLAVLSIDSTEAAALAVIELTRLLEAEGNRATVVDLSGDRLLTRLLQMTGAIGGHEELSSGPASKGPETLPGTSPVLPPAPTGGGAETDDAPIERPFVAFVTPDVPTGTAGVERFAKNAVAIVTAGRSSAVRLRAVAEMTSEAGIELRSILVVDADRDDETLGRIDAAVLSPALSEARAPQPSLD